MVAEPLGDFCSSRPLPPWVIGPIISNIYPVLIKSEIFWSYVTLKFKARQLLHHSWSRDKIILIGPTDHASHSSHWGFSIFMFDVESTVYKSLQQIF
mgnify:CR=1 FL=1